MNHTVWTRTKTRDQDAWYNEDSKRFQIAPPMGTKRSRPKQWVQEEEEDVSVGGGKKQHKVEDTVMDMDTS